MESSMVENLQLMMMVTRPLLEASFLVFKSLVALSLFSGLEA
jgi:hypothetical protein